MIQVRAQRYPVVLLQARCVLRACLVGQSSVWLIPAAFLDRVLAVSLFGTSQGRGLSSSDAVKLVSSYCQVLLSVHAGATRHPAVFVTIGNAEEGVYLGALVHAGVTYRFESVKRREGVRKHSMAWRGVLSECLPGWCCVHCHAGGGGIVSRVIACIQLQTTYCKQQQPPGGLFGIP